MIYIVEKGLLDTPILFLSNDIIENKNNYNTNLRNVTEKSAWESWILFMQKGIEETAQYTLDKIDYINQIMQETILLLKEIYLRVFILKS